MSGGKGGSTTSTVEVPQYIEDAAKRNLLRAQDISQIGYTPYYGPDVAAFTPMQEASFAGTQELASAFGAPTAQGGVSGMPEAQTFAGGIRGYSSAPLFEESLDEFGRRRPAQKAFIDRMFIDPVTGGYTPISPDAPVDVPVDAIVGGGGTGGGGAGGGGGFGGGGGGFGGGGGGFGGGGGNGGGGVPFVPIIDDTGADIINVGREGGTSFTTYGGSQDVANQAVIDAFADYGKEITAGTARPEDNPAFNPEIKAAHENEIITYTTDTGQTVSKRKGQLTSADFAAASNDAATQNELAAASMLAAGIRNVGGGYAQGDTTTGLLGGLQDAYGYISQGPEAVLEDVFGPTSPATQARLADEIAARQASTENSAQRRASELSGLIETVGGQELLDTGAQLAGDQTMALERQFGTLTTSDVVDQANLSQQSIPTGKGSLKDTRKVLDQAAQEGNLGAYVDSFMDKYGGDLNRFQEKTGISNAVMKDIEKIAAAKG